MVDRWRFVFAAVMIVLSVVVLEYARRGVDVTRFDVGNTPVVSYRTADADGPVVIIAHGFAGSAQMMQGYALPLARAGYRVFTFEFLGHGRNRVPMSGDVTAVDGTTRLLVDQTTQVMDAVGDRKVALLGHSMATDVLVRAAQGRADVGPVVLLSAFSDQITALAPRDLLLVSGAWEGRLRAFALEAVRMIDPNATEGQTVKQADMIRRAVAAPFSEHVSILQSRVARAAAVSWIDQGYNRTSDVRILPTGWAILALLAGLVIMFRPVSTVLPHGAQVQQRLNLMQTTAVLLGPALVAPLCALIPSVDFLPVLVADYLVVHLFVFGALQLAVLRAFRVPMGQFSSASFGLLIVFCALIGGALDRYAANFWPTPERVWIIAVMVMGAVPYMLADTALTARQGVLGRLCTRAALLVSLGLAVALDFDGLFFLILIAPVLVLFFMVFGTMGRRAALRGGPLASGIALGVTLAWALGVSFPLFAA